MKTINLMHKIHSIRIREALKVMKELYHKEINTCRSNSKPMLNSSTLDKQITPITITYRNSNSKMTRDNRKSLYILQVLSQQLIYLKTRMTTLNQKILITFQKPHPILTHQNLYPLITLIKLRQLSNNNAQLRVVSIRK